MFFNFRLCIDSDETVRYNLLLEDAEEVLVERVEESLDTEFDVSQDTTAEETEIMQLEDEDSYIDESQDPVIEEDSDEKYQVINLEEIDVQDGIEVNTKSNIAFVNNTQEVYDNDDDDITEKMKAAHMAKEQMKKHKCPYCDKTFMFPSKGENCYTINSQCIFNNNFHFSQSSCRCCSQGFRSP